jgi:uncharacterized protein YndB with AHSA1/START domain
MKVFRVLILAVVTVLVVAVLVLMLLGRRDGAGTVSANIEINRPAAEVWPWVIEPEKLKSWVSGMLEIEHLTPGEPRVGSRGRAVVVDPKQPNVRFNVESEINAIQPPSALTITLHAPEGFHGVVHYQLEGSGGSTRLTCIGEFKFERWFAKLMEPVITSSAQKKLESDLRILRSKAEAAQP